MKKKLCHCGKELHYSSDATKKFVNEMIKHLGEFVDITTPDGTYEVPRHFIALHGIKGNEVSSLGFKKK